MKKVSQRVTGKNKMINGGENIPALKTKTKLKTVLVKTLDRVKLYAEESAIIQDISRGLQKDKHQQKD